jgi:hypothetical protein
MGQQRKLYRFVPVSELNLWAGHLPKEGVFRKLV